MIAFGMACAASLPAGCAGPAISEEADRKAMGDLESFDSMSDAVLWNPARGIASSYAMKAAGPT